MYLYDKVRNNIDVYETSFDKQALRKFKEDRIDSIRTAIIHTNEYKVKEFLFRGQIMFNALDRFDEDKEKYSYIELTNNKEEIEKYLSGEYDHQRPLYILGNNPGVEKANYVNLEDGDYVYLLTGGHYRYDHQFITDDNILLDGELADLQPLLSEDIMNLNYLTEWDYNKEFFNIMNLKKINTLDYKQMEFMAHHELMHPDINLEEKLERSKLVLSLAKKNK